MFRALMGNKVEPWREFIEKHPLEVHNLNAAISHDILEFSARVLTQWAVSFPNALDA